MEMEAFSEFKWLLRLQSWLPQNTFFGVHYQCIIYISNLGLDHDLDYESPKPNLPPIKGIPAWKIIFCYVVEQKKLLNVNKSFGIL